ncbi:unnamed protein product [Linum tenue]|uniref:LysM domain-containing protein n=1 Tax=Linum tenue TaxID=586396 RepID=A0AAV0HYH3_9ROSI|nr:unnamed protein product [Linum tenue]
MVPFSCSSIRTTTCSATLYHITTAANTTPQKVASDYSVSPSQLKPIAHLDRQDLLVTVPCACQGVNGTVAYFYDTHYAVKTGDTFANVSAEVYSGQAWPTGDEARRFIAGKSVTMNLLCGCSAGEDVVTYTVQDGDTLFGVATMLASDVKGIQRLNGKLLGNSSDFIDVGEVLFVPVTINNGTLLG